MTRRIPRATVARLPAYLRHLDSLGPGQQTVQSSDLASASGVNAAKVRKDLSYIGATGVRGVGYDVEELRNLILRRLGLSTDLTVVLIGAGNLGSALARYKGFDNRGFHIVSVYDIDPKRVGKRIAGIEIRHLDRLEEDLERNPADIGIIATPASEAQGVADRLIAAGIPGILNFAPTVIRVPPGATVRQVDLATELQILAFYLGSRRETGSTSSLPERWRSG